MERRNRGSLPRPAGNLREIGPPSGSKAVETAQPPCGQAWRPRFPEPDRGRHAEYLMQPRRAALIPGLPDDQHGLAVHHFCDEVRSLNEPRPDLEVFLEIETVIPPKLTF